MFGLSASQAQAADSPQFLGNKIMTFNENNHNPESTAIK